ncbi:hypothetical protein WOSG25_240180 [Weissella oryzae SG25]|uniref:Phage transcriptional regulator, ArpU family n=1 Tax=Weissella oryzae (strain DSM 25784 / JCM 18191 / LMG 30913 / SG25) TaxID=1329250 RepID=A0A069CX47_WEIOS|nr:DUF1492 domain-containing protein [Weissella oryzae]GAK31952.1 hypothetical protein WOSG25_210090 [Weissella oryzae SG25]GAK32029.1 hypothetical protein WOSG25_240180 [Weissella oryzae SG25]
MAEREIKRLGKIRKWFETDFRIANRRAAAFHEPEFQRIVDLVKSVLEVMQDESSKIIELKFIKELSNNQVMERLDYWSDSTYYRHKKKALLEFADLASDFGFLCLDK